MKYLLSTWLLLFLIGCGNQGQMNLSGNDADFVQDNLFVGNSSCEEMFSAHLKIVESDSYSPTIKLASSNSTAFDKSVLDNKPTMKERCLEIKNHFSGSSIKENNTIIPNDFSIEMSFETTAEQEQQLLAGKAVSVRPETAHFELTDGTLNHAAAELEIRCPNAASITCRVSDMEGYKKCESYNVNYTGECSFRTNLLFFSFSDHKKAQLNVEGTLRVSGMNATQIKYTKVSWLGLY